MHRMTLTVWGLGCGGAGAQTIQGALAEVPGVADVYVNPLTQTAYIEADNTCQLPRLAAAVAGLSYRITGFHLLIPEPAHKERRTE